MNEGWKKKRERGEGWEPWLLAEDLRVATTTEAWMACSDADCQATAHADLLYKGRQGKEGRKKGKKEWKEGKKKKKTSLEASKQDELSNIICKQPL